MFVGRKGEIEALNAFFEKDNCKVAVVYGSFGVGKTTLLRHFAEEKKSLYIDAYETTGKQQLAMISKRFGLPQTAKASDICDKITDLASKSKILIVFDQYQNIVKSDSGLDETLNEYARNQWANLPVKLVFCSDAFVLIDKYVRSKKSIWKDLVDLDMLVEPFGFYDSLEFLGSASTIEAAYLYGITGGIAYNLVRASKMNGSLKEITIKLFLDKENAVGLNPEMVMASELRELAYYNYMLATMAKGFNRVNQISAEVDKPKDIVVPYLNTLIAIGVCKKETAITEQNNRKKTRYSIVNTSTLFWYKYIVANYDKYAAGAIESLWQTIDDDMDSFMETVFIRICAEYLRDRSRKNMLPFTIEEIGNWWVNDEEAGTSEGFDLVSLGKCNGKSATVFCQCYYNHFPIEVPQLKSLIEKTKQLHRQGDVFYLVFSKAGFNENAITISSAIKNIMLITLDEMR